jgi:hypothetical protein
MPDSLGWKVVAVDNHGVMYSCISKYPVEYEYDVWTTQPTDGGPLTVFTDRVSAEDFIHNRGGKIRRQLRIIRCRYTPSEETRVYYNVWDSSSDTADGQGGESHPLIHLPAHTALATRVMLLNWR